MHITGGGFVENIPRILPEGLGAHLDRSTWEEQPIFGLLRTLGNLSDADMVRTFNCGLGLVFIVPESDAEAVAAVVPGARVVGRVTSEAGVVVK